jgi:hypothetical protein
MRRASFCGNGSDGLLYSDAGAEGTAESSELALGFEQRLGCNAQAVAARLVVRRLLALNTR